MTLSYPKGSIFRRALERWGEANQIEMLEEEMAELTVAIHHFYRSRADRSNVIEELADVQIVLHQMIYIFGVDDFEKKYSEKIIRLEEKLSDL